MIGIDTNILARYYIQDESDAEAKKQHLAAKTLFDSDAQLFVCKTVVLEFEWVMRGYYKFSTNEIFSVLEHLFSLNFVVLEDNDALQQALLNYKLGLDFADALHHACYHHCSSIASFDDKKFSKRAQRLGLLPPITVPK